MSRNHPTSSIPTGTTRVSLSWTGYTQLTTSFFQPGQSGWLTSTMHNRQAPRASSRVDQGRTRRDGQFATVQRGIADAMHAA